MTEPRNVVPRRYYLVTRRCYQRTFRLRPSELTNQILEYCLALALEKTGVLLHGGCAMSDHHHLVVSDPHGCLPDFLQEFHRLTAKALNAAHGQRENLWAAEQCSFVELPTEHDVRERIAYVAANPVTAGLVRSPAEWPGLMLFREREIRVARPPVYFAKNGKCPPVLTLRVVAPVMDASSESVATWNQRLRAAITNKVAAAHIAMRRARRKFQGRARVLAASIFERAQSEEPRRTMIPDVASADPEARRSAVAKYRAFRAAYRHALTKWKSGQRDAVFPVGTWWMRVHHAVVCASPPGAAA